MSTNSRKIKRDLAKKIESEIFTIQTELNNLDKDLPALKFEYLNKCEYNLLKRIRKELQDIQMHVKNVRYCCGQ